MNVRRRNRLYMGLFLISLMLLLGIQFVLTRAYREAANELAHLSGAVENLRSGVTGRQSLVEEYRVFEDDRRVERTFPSGAAELQTAIDGVLEECGVEHTNRPEAVPSVNGEGGVEFRVVFDGPYYSVVKALAALRESRFAMRVAKLKIHAGSQDRVTGAMTVLSRVKGGDEP